MDRKTSVFTQLEKQIDSGADRERLNCRDVARRMPRMDKLMRRLDRIARWPVGKMDNNKIAS